MGRSAARLRDEWTELGVNDIEGKAARGAATERGREGVSIMKDEIWVPARGSGLLQRFGYFHRIHQENDRENVPEPLHF